jgi:selenocysteine lyase/cysteine desulfurase
MLSLDNIAVRAGKLCAHPIVNRVSGGKGVLRVSPGIYTDKEDINNLVEGLCKAVKRLS